MHRACFLLFALATPLVLSSRANSGVEPSRAAKFPPYKDHSRDSAAFPRTFAEGRVVAVAGFLSIAVYYFGSTRRRHLDKRRSGGFSLAAVCRRPRSATGSVGAPPCLKSDPNVDYACMVRQPASRETGPPATESDSHSRRTDLEAHAWKRSTSAPCVHPRNPNIVYLAALGHHFAAK